MYILSVRPKQKKYNCMDTGREKPKYYIVYNKILDRKIKIEIIIL